MNIIQQPSLSFICKYPEIEKFRDVQLKSFWTADEITVEKDVHDILTNFTDAEKHGIFTTLKLFTHYEAKAGEEYWTGRFMKMFPRHEFTSMAATFGMMELAVHAPFYNKINVLLNAHDEGFYTDYIQNPVLVARMKSIDSIISDKDDLLSLAGFSMVEGVILYSSFAFLKHFQSLGKNKLLNVVRGINFSVRDENLHAEAGAWCFKQLLKETKTTFTEEQKEKLNLLVNTLVAQEFDIIDMIFSQGEIEGIKETDLKSFVLSRVNICLTNLGLPSKYSINKNPIAEWFYSGINRYQMNDFFTGQGREYVRNWNEEAFIWNV